MAANRRAIVAVSRPIVALIAQRLLELIFLLHQQLEIAHAENIKRNIHAETRKVVPEGERFFHSRTRGNGGGPRVTGNVWCVYARTRSRRIRRNYRPAKGWPRR